MPPVRVANTWGGFRRSGQSSVTSYGRTGQRRHRARPSAPSVMALVNQPTRNACSMDSHKMRPLPWMEVPRRGLVHEDRTARVYLLVVRGTM